MSILRQHKRSMTTLKSRKAKGDSSESKYVDASNILSSILTQESDPRKILDRAKSLIGYRGASYGGIEDSFGRAAKIASLKLNREFTAHDVVVILESVKDARLAINPSHEDSLIDRINYAAFRVIFAKETSNG